MALVMFSGFLRAPCLKQMPRARKSIQQRRSCGYRSSTTWLVRLVALYCGCVVSSLLLCRESACLLFLTPFAVIQIKQENWDRVVELTTEVCEWVLHRELPSHRYL